ncbi:hypothetical protein SAMN05428945_5252 [Streptomyces sp. 2224.1]|nr:hypothetical protein BX261_0082 [Streptomyces sp. 2321.6]SDR59516.1 hypothetical protein SAMN05216511_7143 [Streptomyces sp. KS_16]SEB68209.1 hypothetical protein SAMN05428940_0082 [Streptomyces sp. 2133.1]SED55261.1 hypothetical protein SAMN05428945_5252 [Streptomyces sp. 2224.1]SEF18104.1 hypothetical protein SAMN05428954_7195 [Streptomyces sp. 2112.3]SNC59565.1 hypothetical protein SAMN06272741_0084 [Streptomyces sp. 2114.4]
MPACRAGAAVTVSGVYAARDQGGTNIAEGKTPHVVVYRVITEKP